MNSETTDQAPTTDAAEALTASDENPDGTGTSDDTITEELVDDAPESFPREVVEKLRQENGKYRQRAQQADTLAQRLHAELVKATGRLADPTDLAFDETHLDDPDALVTAINELLADKPHLASRRPVGDIGQGALSGTSSSVDLAALLRQRAR